MTAAPIRLCIPEDVAYADLRLSRDPVSGDVSFDWEPIERICEASGLDPTSFHKNHDERLQGLLVAWYLAAREQGEPVDHTQEQLLAEAQARDDVGVWRVQRGTGRLN